MKNYDDWKLESPPEFDPDCGDAEEEKAERPTDYDVLKAMLERAIARKGSTLANLSTGFFDQTRIRLFVTYDDALSFEFDAATGELKDIDMEYGTPDSNPYD